MIRVMIVDDSGVYRMLLTKALQECANIELVGTASDGDEAIKKVDELRPDVITLDMNMPRMNGMETLAVLAVKYPSVQVVIVTSETRNDAERAVSILEAGAFEMVLKPKAIDASPMETLRHKLYPIIKAAAKRKGGLNTSEPKPIKEWKTAATSSQPGFKPDIVLIGSSTGGPAALYDVLCKLEASFPIPVLVVQHMPKLFVESLATRLNKDIPLPCVVAEENTELKAGHIYFAPGDIHSDVVRTEGGKLTIHFNDGEPEHYCKPAVDTTLRSLESLADTVKTMVVILTGMGKDGAMGAKLLSEQGARVIAQDEESSVVWGMPGETVRLGAAHQILPLDKIGSAITQQVGFRRR